MGIFSETQRQPQKWFQLLATDLTSRQRAFQRRSLLYLFTALRQDSFDILHNSCPPVQVFP